MKNRIILAISILIFSEITMTTLAAPAKKQRITVCAMGNLSSKDRIYGEEAVANMIEKWRTQLKPIWPDCPDIVVLPEACDRYLSHTMKERREYYRIRGNRILSYFQSEARKHHCYIAYAAAREMPDGSCRNSVQLIDRRGKVVGIYDKNYLVPDETKLGGMLCGKDVPVFETDFGRVAMIICFDLNFTELLERVKRLKPDLILFSSMYHGGLMQGYWAYQCRAHFIGAVSSNECTVLNPLGTVIARSSNYYPHLTASINLDCKVIHLDDNWDKILAVKERYGRGVTFFDPGRLGAVLLSSELPDRSMEEILSEFNIKTWDEYYQRCTNHRKKLTNMEK